MKELSLNILDIAENSVKAGATLTKILIDEDESCVQITVSDDGCGMSEETLKHVTDPFYTTRTTRRVGLGIPFFKLQAEQTGGRFSITSRAKETHPDDHGTETKALFYKNHIDFTPLGDVCSSITTLIQGHPETDFFFRHRKGTHEVLLDTRELRGVLGDVSLAEYDVIKWIDEYLREQYVVFE